MLFNSVGFGLFFFGVFFLYWFVFNNRRVGVQNFLLLIASYFFYACWDWRFLFLLMFSTGLDYYTGLRISASSSQRQRKFWVWLSITANVGFLAVFKYYDFFITSFADMVSVIGWQPSPWTLQLILPVGISFYTFHGLSYILDIYNKRIEAEPNLVTYSVFVAFFPLLVAGPIERATHLLPQLKRVRVFEYSKAADGLRQILWGLVKKVVIADGCSVYVDEIFNNSGSYSGSTLLLGAVLFAVQIYGDFSGYSDIALGCARLLGIDLLRNFAYPYFSRDIAEFWRRWHISLTSWFRDYVYIPLGGSRGSMLMTVRNIFIIFILSGLWHGARWTFVAWGIINALFFIPLLITNRNRNNIDTVAHGKALPGARDFFSIVFTFSLTVFAWIFFRSPDLGYAFQYIGHIFTPSIFSLPSVPGIQAVFLILMAMIVAFFVIEWYARELPFAIAGIAVKKGVWRWSCYYLLVACVVLFAVRGKQFIYFQF